MAGTVRMLCRSITPRVEPLAHLAHPVGDGDGGTPHAQGRWTTHRHPIGALATVPATLCERTHRVRAPAREPLRHQTIIVDRLIAPMGVCEPVPVIGTHLLADIPVSCGCDKHAGARVAVVQVRCSGCIMSHPLCPPHISLHQTLSTSSLRPYITVDAGIRKMQSPRRSSRVHQCADHVCACVLLSRGQQGTQTLQSHTPRPPQRP